MKSYSRIITSKRESDLQVSYYRERMAHLNGQMRNLEKSVRSILESDNSSLRSPPKSSRSLSTVDTSSAYFLHSGSMFSPKAKIPIVKFVEEEEEMDEAPSYSKGESRLSQERVWIPKKSEVEEVVVESNEDEEAFYESEHSQLNIYGSKDSLYVAAGSMENLNFIGEYEQNTLEKYIPPRCFGVNEDITPGTPAISNSSSFTSSILEPFMENKKEPRKDADNEIEEEEEEEKIIITNENSTQKEENIIENSCSDNQHFDLDYEEEEDKNFVPPNTNQQPSITPINNNKQNIIVEEEEIEEEEEKGEEEANAEEEYKPESDILRSDDEEEEQIPVDEKEDIPFIFEEEDLNDNTQNIHKSESDVIIDAIIGLKV